MNQEEAPKADPQGVPELHPGPVIQFDHAGRILSANFAAFALWGPNVNRGADVKALTPALADLDTAAIIQEGRRFTISALIGDKVFDFAIRGTRNLEIGGIYGTDVTDLKRETEELEQEVALRQQEKLAALGKLAAGLAHELNNPAAAAKRAAADLPATVRRMYASGMELHRFLDTNGWEALDRTEQSWHDRQAEREQLSPVARSQREDDLTDWLSNQGLAEPWSLAATLVEGGIDAGDLERLSEEFPSGLDVVVNFLTNSLAVTELGTVVTSATGRISDLVSAVKGYTFMDQEAEHEVDIHEGIEQTLTILGFRLQPITVQREFDRALPMIRVAGADLNQVWTNLIDNAIDAILEVRDEGDGTITIKTSGDEGEILVEISDNGAGIPDSVRARVFEPFFTTKAQGQGTGLGLDISKRTIDAIGGHMEVESRPGETCFLVTLPVGQSEPPATD